MPKKTRRIGAVPIVASIRGAVEVGKLDLPNERDTGKIKLMLFA